MDTVTNLKDGYRLYGLLRDGNPVEVAYEDQTYTFVFMGVPVGSNNYLSVTDRSGEQKRYGRGWGSEQVWHALDHLKQGWDTKQVPRYRAYNDEVEE